MLNKNPNIEKLIQAAELVGHLVVSFRPESRGFRIEYVDLKMSGVRPVLEYCRDNVDFELLCNQWLDRGRLFSDYYDGFGEMLEQETNRLNKLRAVLE